MTMALILFSVLVYLPSKKDTPFLARKLTAEGPHPHYC